MFRRLRAVFGQPAGGPSPADAPAAPEAEGYAAGPSPSDAAEPENCSPVRVLLVEDNPINRKVMRLMLEPAGVELCEAENGAEGVDAFRACAFDVVLMDIQMPVMDGLTAIGLIRAHEAAHGLARTPVLVVSANAMPEHVQASMEAGADRHLAKPVSVVTLLSSLQWALAEHPRRSSAAA